VTKTWRCSVCGYLHEGHSPPEFCPLCHATADKFELVETVAGNRSLVAGLNEELCRMRETFAPHAVSAHFPTALIPTCSLFLLLAIIYSYPALDFVAFSLLMVAVASIPLTMFSGFLLWRRSYRKVRSVIVDRKIRLAWILLFIAAVTLSWRWLYPDLVTNGGIALVLYLLLNLLMLVCVTLLGHYGGMLAATKRK
jgi:uncharacterized membrane protein